MEEILAHREKKKMTEYLVKWEGYSRKGVGTTANPSHYMEVYVESTWEPATSLPPEGIDKYARHFIFG